jgi:hypothetical protein
MDQAADPESCLKRRALPVRAGGAGGDLALEILIPGGGQVADRAAAP